MQSWSLREIATPDGTRDPVVLHSESEARAVLLEIQPGQALREHQVKEHAWVVVVEGVAQVSSAERELEAPVGTLVHFEPNERHAVSSAEGARILLLLAPWPGEGHYRGDRKAADA